MPPAAAPRRRAALEQPLDAERQLVRERHLGDRHVDHHLPRGTSSFFSAASMTVYSVGVATISSVLLSLSATTCRLRTTPSPHPRGDRGRRAAPTAAARRGRRRRGAAVCPWNVGGLTIVPAGVPGASVGAGAPAARRAARERLLQQRRELLGALVLQVEDVEAQPAARPAAVEALDPLLRLLEVRGLRRDHQQRVHPLDRDDAQDAGERAVAVAHTLSSSWHDRS